MKNKFIVTAAITGAIHTPTMSPHLPITSDEIVKKQAGPVMPARPSYTFMQGTLKKGNLLEHRKCLRNCFPE